MYAMRKKHAYQSKALNNALKDVQTGTRNVNEASRHPLTASQDLPLIIGSTVAMAGKKEGRKLSQDDEEALVEYIRYMDAIGHPLGISEIKTFAWSISKRSINPDCFGDNGPSHKWWRGFRLRHKNLTLRKPDKLDRRRNNTAKRSVVREHFEKLKESLEKANLLNKPEHIFNVDETGMEMNKGTGKVVVDRSVKKHYQESVGDREHITANVCYSSSGHVLPPMIIFQHCFPSSDYSRSGPDGCLYAKSESGYMDGELFKEWFTKIFLPKTSHLRPAMLILDGHCSHLTIDLIDLARENDIILYCLPPHLTYLLQPLDVAVFKSLKVHFTKFAHQVKLVSLASKKILTVNRTNFTALFREAFEACMIMSTIKNGFRKCGIYPYDPSSIDWTKLKNDEITEEVPVPPATSSTSSALSAAEAAVRSHPLVENKVVPERLTDVLLIPHFEGKKVVSVRVTTSARVLTSDEHRQLLQSKLDEKAKKEAEKLKRRVIREQRRHDTEQQRAEKQLRTNKGSKVPAAPVCVSRASQRISKLPRQNYAKVAANQRSESESEAEEKVCCRCGDEDPPGDEPSIDWLECDSCERWYHVVCEFPDQPFGPFICSRC